MSTQDTRGDGSRDGSARVSRTRFVWWLMALAFALRVAVGLARGEAQFLANSYSFYVLTASNFLEGHGLCASAWDCARRLPVYPLLLTPFVATDTLFPGVVVTQAAVGASLVAIIWRIADRLFSRQVATVAAVLTALHPYYVIHDTRLQETVLTNVGMALAVLWLLRVRRSDDARVGLAAGLVMAITILTTARVAMFLPFALIGVAFGHTSWRRGGRSAMLVLLPVVLLVGGWMWRNLHTVGSPVLTTESGVSLWVANNPWTFSHFPERSIDLSVRESYARLNATDHQTLAAFSDDVVAYDRQLGRWGMDFIRQHPADALRGAARKLWVVVAAQYSPARGLLVQTGYFAIFAAVHVMAAIGLWQSRRRWREHAVVYALFLSFLLTTAVFWAHTSHKSYLDVFLFMYAAAGASWAFARLTTRQK